MALLRYFLLLMFGISGFRADQCSDDLRHLASVQGNFVQCTVKNVNPAKSCTGCLPEYQAINNKYADLLKNSCSDKYLNQNRLNIVYNMQTTLIETWNKGFCDDCFEGGIPSNSSVDFGNLKTPFDNCLNNSKSDPCFECKGDYLALNGFYKQMDKEKKGKICFDIQDAMNRTRSTWSKSLKCCRREFSLTLFIVGSSLFGALTLVFYLGMYGYTKHLERNHEIIDSTLYSENQASTSSGILSNLQSEPVATTSTGIVTNTNDIKNIKQSDSIEGQSSSRQINEPLIDLHMS